MLRVAENENHGRKLLLLAGTSQENEQNRPHIQCCDVHQPSLLGHRVLPPTFTIEAAAQLLSNARRPHFKTLLGCKGDVTAMKCHLLWWAWFIHQRWCWEPHNKKLMGHRLPPSQVWYVCAGLWGWHSSQQPGFCTALHLETQNLIQPVESRNHEQVENTKTTPNYLTHLTRFFMFCFSKNVNRHLKRSEQCEKQENWIGLLQNVAWSFRDSHGLWSSPFSEG